MFREDLYNNYITVKGLGAGPGGATTVTFQCDKMTAPGTKAKDTKYRPGNGNENELSLGGPRKNDNVTLTKLYDTSIDPWNHWLYHQAGRAVVEVKRQPINDANEPWGQAIVLTGKLIEWMPPPSDAESEKASLCEFVVSLETEVA